MDGLGTSPEKKSVFIPQKDKFLTGRQHMEALGFYSSIAKLQSLQKQ